MEEPGTMGLTGLGSQADMASSGLDLLSALVS